MLEKFTIFHTGGAVLWSKDINEDNESVVDSESINQLIQVCWVAWEVEADDHAQNVLLDEHRGQQEFSYQQESLRYTLRWEFENELSLVFVVVYLNLSHLFDAAALLNVRVQSALLAIHSVQAVKRRFCELYSAEIKGELGAPGRYAGFDEEFEACVARSLHMGATTPAPPPKPKHAKADEPVARAVSAPVEAEAPRVNHSKLQQLRQGKGRGGMRRRKVRKRKGMHSGGGSTEEPEKVQGKVARVWGKNQLSREAATALDYSKPSDEKENGEAQTASAARKYLNAVGKVDASKYESESEQSEEEEEEETQAEEAKPKKRGGIFSYLTGLVSNTPLTAEQIAPALERFKHLLRSKNVATDITERLCASVSASLEGKKIGTFTTVRSTVKRTLEEALARILTPKKLVNIMRGVRDTQKEGRPFSIVFVGVNGVGKSTSLAKIASFFLSKHLKVSIAACDTFRSGAVEQLRTHAQCLYQAWGHEVPLYEKGYNKDAASVAMDAIRQATTRGDDVVLVDTAGRMQDNEPLMKALSKLINLNRPDLVLFVGEALVGNDGVDQLMKFNRCLADLSTAREPRLIDGIILTKFDTIDEKVVPCMCGVLSAVQVGAAITMMYTTGQPIVFVGTGQKYEDLKKPSARMITRLLLR